MCHVCACVNKCVCMGMPTKRFEENNKSCQNYLRDTQIIMLLPNKVNSRTRLQRNAIRRIVNQWIKVCVKHLECTG